MHAEDLTMDGPAIQNGFLRELTGYDPKDIDPRTGDPRPGATKVRYVYDYPV